VHAVRLVVAMAEHCMIGHFKAHPMLKDRCANKKVDLDTHISFDDSDEERPDSGGPHCLYIAWGFKGPKHRN